MLGGTGVALTKSGAGTLVLSSSNTYTGATSVSAGTLTLSGSNLTSGVSLSGGKLNINNLAALGAGTFTVSAGTIDNTYGSAITLSTNNLIAVNTTGFTFTGSADGSHNLNLGTGAVTLRASSTITVGSGNLTFGGAIGGGAHSLTKAGTGTLTLAGANTFTYGVTLSAGQLNINNSWPWVPAHSPSAPPPPSTTPAGRPSSWPATTPSP